MILWLANYGRQLTDQYMENKIKYEFGPKEISYYLGISKHTLTKYRGLGLPTVGHGKYDLVAAVAWFVQYREKMAVKKDRGRLPVKDEKKKDGVDRLIEARAVKVEMENAIKQGELLEYEPVRGLFQSFCTITANYFESLGSRMAPIVAEMEEPAEVEDEIRKESRKILRLFAERLRKGNLYETHVKEDHEKGEDGA